MCGIAGIFRIEGSVTADDVAAVRTMMEAQIHRGPDGEGMYRDSRIVLGHRRLAIIDLSEAGRQPMANEDGNIRVSYNGEIYNFEELRSELVQLGHRVQSKTDTEILLHGYEQWGIEGLLRRLRGMFAFALYDSRKTPSGPQVILAKDRFGIKPIYFHEGVDRIVFASEVRALLRSGLVSKEIDKKSLIRFLQLGSVPVPLTTEKNISSLSAGEYMILDQRGTRIRRYWKIQDFLNSKPFDKMLSTRTTGDVGALLEEAAKIHLISDVPLGVFLSGGIDSSALVALASRFSDAPLDTLSIVFRESEYNEAAYARLVAGKFKTRHHETMLGEKDLIDELPLIMTAMDQPTVDGINTYFVSKAAKQQGLKVVLSGIGGDELFWGYGHYRNAQKWGGLLRRISAMSPFARQAFITILRAVGHLSSAKSFDRLSYLNIASDAGSYCLFRGLFSQDQIQELLGLGEREILDLGPPIESFNGYLSGDRHHKSSHALCDSFNVMEFQGYLQNQLLKDADFMSMAHSIETRVPFLDHRLVEYLMGLPGKEKISKTMNKPLLINSLGSDLPREIWDRPKMGFTFPFEPWLRKTMGEFRESFSENGPFEVKVVNKLWKGFLAGQIHWSRPWALIVANRFR